MQIYDHSLNNVLFAYLLCSARLEAAVALEAAAALL